MGSLLSDHEKVLDAWQKKKKYTHWKHNMLQLSPRVKKNPDKVQYVQ